MSAQTLLDRLEAVKQTAPDRWLARCPAHDDRSPSLSIREADDGTILLKCFAGCGAAEIVQAVGLSLADLFPQGAKNHRIKPSRNRIPPSDLLLIVQHEALVIAMIADAMVRDQVLDIDERNRLNVATSRILAAYGQ